MGKNPPPVRILIADDHALFREGLRRLLEAERDFEVVGEAADGLEAVTLAQRLHPNILLLDLAMPRRPGLEALRELAGAGSPVRILLLTAAVEKVQIIEALQLGARGVVLKDAASQLLLKSIRAVMAGQYWVGRNSVADLVQYLRELTASTREETRQKTFGLTPREREIIGAIVAGSTNRDIARQLSISEDTVKHHLTNIFDKTGVSTRLELALFAVNHRLVS
jgi:DNA-binding NarL/FixJ family response regulator